MRRARRRFTPEIKAQIVRRHLAVKTPVSVLAEEFGVQPSQMVGSRSSWPRSTRPSRRGPGMPRWAATRTAGSSGWKPSSSQKRGDRRASGGKPQDYDTLGQVVRSERLSGLVVSIANTGDVYEAALVDPGVVLWSSTTTYDGLGRVASSTDRTGGVSESRYNAVGQVVETACKPAIKPTFYAG